MPKWANCERSCFILSSLAAIIISSCILFTLNYQDVYKIKYRYNRYRNVSNPTANIPEPISLNPITLTPVSENKPSNSPKNTTKDPDPIILDPNDQYIDLNVYSKHIQSANNNSESIPSSWQHLNNQQFCTVPSHKDSIGLQNFLKFIYNIQFPADCNDEKHKFLIFDIALEAKQGLGASLLGNLKRYFAAALQKNRIFLISGKHDWASDMPYCKGKDAMECYFLPPSSCNPLHILSTTNTSNPQIYHKGSRPKDCAFGNNIVENAALPECTQRILHITHGSPNYVMLNGEINDYLKSTFDGLNMMAYESMVTAFFMRPQPNVRSIIYEKIQKSINKSFDGNVPININTKNLIAYPIRASDKCNSIGNITGKHYTHLPETVCFNPLEHVRIMNSIKYLTNDAIKTVIFTSEDLSFLQKVRALMMDETVSNVGHWKVIMNTEDYSVGEGTTTYKNTIKVFNQSLGFEVGGSLETDHIVSALSSLVFQVHMEPEYIVYGDSSTWLKLMWKWLSFLNCNVKQEMYRRDNTKCVELATPGYLHYYGQFKYKFVKYTKKLWQRIHDENLEPKRFEEKFGINITHFGWDAWCEKGFKEKLKY